MLPAECQGSLCCKVVSGRLRSNAAAVFLFTLTAERVNYFTLS